MQTSVPTLRRRRKRHSVVASASEPVMPQLTSTPEGRRENTPAAPASVAAAPLLAELARTLLGRFKDKGYRITKDNVAAGPEFESASHVQTQTAEVHSWSHGVEPMSSTSGAYH